MEEKKKSVKFRKVPDKFLGKILGILNSNFILKFRWSAPMTCISKVIIIAKASQSCAPSPLICKWTGDDAAPRN